MTLSVRVLEEHGYESALAGLSLSFNQDPDKMENVARHLAFKGDGHNKFLESIVLWLDVDAPRYWWSQFDTYRVGVSKQSESTMHTITKRPLSQEDFSHPIPLAFLQALNQAIRLEQWYEAKAMLPESFLQRRIICLNYMALQRIIRQRRDHRLPEWHEFIDQVLDQVQHREFLEVDEWKGANARSSKS